MGAYHVTVFFLSFSAVMLLCALCNIIGMIYGINPPPLGPWFGGWFMAGILVSTIAVLKS